MSEKQNQAKKAFKYIEKKKTQKFSRNEGRKIYSLKTTYSKKNLCGFTDDKMSC